MLIFVLLLTAKFIVKNYNFREQFVLGSSVANTLFLLQLNDQFFLLPLEITWSSKEVMGSCCSCPDKETVPDNHRNKFKVSLLT